MPLRRLLVLCISLGFRPAILYQTHLGVLRANHRLNFVLNGILIFSIIIINVAVLCRLPEENGNSKHALKNEFLTVFVKR